MTWSPVRKPDGQFRDTVVKMYKSIYFAMEAQSHAKTGANIKIINPCHYADINHLLVESSYINDNNK